MVYHILNGDALKEQLPNFIKGERIVMRECLIEGDVQGETLNSFLLNRAAFISQQYEGYTEAGYLENVVPEIERIQDIPNDAEIYFWFEKDLFCQINWWFTIHLLSKQFHRTKAYLVLPTAELQYGFGGMNKADFLQAMDHAIPLTDTVPLLSKLWPLYQKRDYDGLKNIAQKLIKDLPFLITAVEVEIDRNLQNGRTGKPQLLLQEIQNELGSQEFGPIFREFSKRAAIYGFGDVQVKRILEEMSKA